MADRNLDWNFFDERSKLLALGVHNQDTSDIKVTIAERHDRKSELVERLRLSPTDHVLDLGSGMGFTAQVIAPLVARLHCADVSEQFLEDCRQNTRGLQNVECHRITYADLGPLSSKGIQKCYATLLFIHFNFYDILFYLKELRNVLADGGLLYFDYLDGERFNLHNSADSFHEHLAIYKASREHWIFGCMHMTSLGILRNLVPQVGFKIVQNWTSETSFSQLLLQKV